MLSLPGPQYIMNCPCLTRSRIQWNLMSMDRDFRCLNLLLASPAAVVLSVWIGVGGCLCPNSSNVVRRIMASCPLKNSPAYSASAADAITLRRILLTAWSGPFGGGGVTGGLLGFCDGSLRKKCPPTRLRAFRTERYDASLWTWRTIPLAWYRILAFGCVAA